MGACLLVPPAIFTFPVHLKPMNIMFHGSDPISSSGQFRDEFFNQSRFATIRFSND
jgi:hypothetical protein